MLWGEKMEMISMGSPVDFRVVSPYWLTSVGRLGCACATRFYTSTWSRLTFVSTPNVTVNCAVPSLALVDCI